MTTVERRNLRNGLIFVAPWLVGLGAFMLYPILASLYYSFCDYSVLEEACWIGPLNYTDLATDEVFWKSLGNTLYYAAFALPLGLIVSLGLALLLNTGVRGLAGFRTVFFLPSLVPMVALAILWMWIFNGEHGILNYLLRPIVRWLHHAPGLSLLAPTLDAIGLNEAPNWLSDPRWSKPALIFMSAWGVGHAMVIYLAGLQDVPAELYEAADLDGAGWWQKLRHVTLPMLSPVILFNLIMGIIGSLQFFAVPYVMSPVGAPARSTYFLTMYLYDNAFLYLKMGYACAMAWILFVVIFVLTMVALKLTEKRVYYGGG